MSGLETSPGKSKSALLRKEVDMQVILGLIAELQRVKRLLKSCFPGTSGRLTYVECASVWTASLRNAFGAMPYNMLHAWIERFVSALDLTLDLSENDFATQAVTLMHQSGRLRALSFGSHLMSVLRLVGDKIPQPFWVMYQVRRLTNTHSVSANSIEVTNLENSTLKLKINGDGIVTHGEHGTLVTESPNVIKYNQQEFNPITRKLQNAYD